LGQTQELLTAANTEAQKHVLALEELTAAEKSIGFISRAQDTDPYLAGVREAVAKEAQTYSAAYPEGAGLGLRYTAFDRYTSLARQSVERLQAGRRALSGFREQLKPLDPTEKQLRGFRQVYDEIPWSDVTQAVHQAKIERAPIPNYADFVDRTVAGQEDLLIAFEELVAAPTARHVFSFVLAAFIDVIVFLVAFASGPYFYGSTEQRWLSAAAAVEGLDEQIFVRGFLRKVTPAARGLARVRSDELNAGEQQLCLLLVSKGLAIIQEKDGQEEDGQKEEGKPFYLLDDATQELLLESLATRGLPLRASTAAGG
jgi:hypothetical protein